MRDLTLEIRTQENRRGAGSAAQPDTSKLAVNRECCCSGLLLVSRPTSFVPFFSSQTGFIRKNISIDPTMVARTSTLLLDTDRECSIDGVVPAFLLS